MKTMFLPSTLTTCPPTCRALVSPASSSLEPSLQMLPRQSDAQASADVAPRAASMNVPPSVPLVEVPGGGSPVGAATTMALRVHVVTFNMANKAPSRCVRQGGSTQTGVHNTHKILNDCAQHTKTTNTQNTAHKNTKYTAHRIEQDVHIQTSAVQGRRPGVLEVCYHKDRARILRELE